MRIKDSRFVRSAAAARDLAAEGRKEVAFAGRSNVGKSSLLNRLLNRKGLARTGATPGRTRAVNYFLVNEEFHFVDLPGYGYARVAKSERRSWAELVEAYLRRVAGRPDRTLVVQIVDAKVGATPLDVEAIEYLRSLGIEPLVVATKIDKLSRGRWRGALAKVRRTLGLAEGDPVVAFSARTGEGVRELWQRIDHHLAGGAPGTN